MEQLSSGIYECGGAFIVVVVVMVIVVVVVVVVGSGPATITSNHFGSRRCIALLSGLCFSPINVR